MGLELLKKRPKTAHEVKPLRNRIYLVLYRVLNAALPGTYIPCTQHSIYVIPRIYNIVVVVSINNAATCTLSAVYIVVALSPLHHSFLNLLLLLLTHRKRRESVNMSSPLTNGCHCVPTCRSYDGLSHNTSDRSSIPTS